MSIIHELAGVRGATGHTQQQLAARAGLSRMTVQRIEAQEIDPRLSSVVEMARAMGMSLMLVPQDLRGEVEAFLRSGGRTLGQPAGAGAPPSVVETLMARDAPRLAAVSTPARSTRAARPPRAAGERHAGRA